MNTKDIEILFAQMLSGNYEDDLPWNAVTELSQIGSREVFDRCAECCKSENALVRARAADVLAQFGKTADHPSNNFPEESYFVVSSLLQSERDTLPIKSALSALGHIGDPRAIPIIVHHISHPHDNVRFHAACALGTFANDPRAIEALLSLMQDADADVRDWATFGLGVLGTADSEQIRNSLLLRIYDTDEDTKEEAIVGLSKRKDRRVVPFLIAMLQQENVPDRAIEAADFMLDGSINTESCTARQYEEALRREYLL